jgi:ferritin
MQEMSNRPTSALHSETEQLLNHQIAIEGQASAAYLAMASWCDVRGYKQSANFLYAQSNEEREHMLKLVHYVNNLGGHALQPEIIGIQRSFQSLREVFEIAFNREISVTKSIHRLVEHCWNQKDLATYHFLQWYVGEQIEEEITARKILELFDVIGEAGIGLYMIDKEIGALKSINS